MHLTKKGYFKIGKNGYLSRIIMEKQVGRSLTKDECVHHLDKNTMNNDIENLKVLSRSDHTRLHQKGKEVSEETRGKLSESAMGNKRSLGCVRSEETKQRISKTKMGKEVSLETRRRLSEARMGKTHSEETRRKISQSNLGKTRSEETLRRMSEATIKAWEVKRERINR